MKDLKISKELASAVLNKEVTKCSLINKSRNSINITYFEDKEDFNPICREWNIYEFAFKCKKWATKYNFQLVSWTVAFEAVKKKGYCQTHNTQDKNRENDKPFRENTEVEAIIKACEWVLEQIKCN